MKSALMVPADKPNLLQKLPTLECDVAIINLEDGVFDKRQALINLQNILPTLEKTNKFIVRTNALNEGGKEEIEALKNIQNLDGFRIAKIKKPQEVEQALSLCKTQEIHLSIETKEAFSNISQLKIDARVTTVYLGILDLFNSMNISHEIIKIENQTTNYILSKFLCDSLCADFWPVSFVFQDYQNLDAFKLWCEFEKSLGFGAKGCISPKQVKIANEVFGNNLELEKAYEIKKIFEESIANKISGFSHEKYGFIDEPIYKNALNIIKKANI